ncbi:hypothetical protein [Sneathia vaginalis]|nr:hypothetical protein [Sneathia vaginalis]
MSTHIFQCKKCGLAVQKENFSYPSGTCPNGGFHDWAHTTV